MFPARFERTVSFIPSIGGLYARGMYQGQGYVMISNRYCATQLLDPAFDSGLHKGRWRGALIFSLIYVWHTVE